LFTYTVEVEDGVELEGGPVSFATTVDSTLHDPKSWIGSERYRFQRIDDSRAATLRISLTSQLTTRRLCGFEIPFDDYLATLGADHVTADGLVCQPNAWPFPTVN
jgi:hypothetical protein